MSDPREAGRRTGRAVGPGEREALMRALGNLRRGQRAMNDNYTEQRRGVVVESVPDEPQGAGAGAAGGSMQRPREEDEEY